LKKNKIKKVSIITNLKENIDCKDFQNNDNLASNGNSLERNQDLSQKKYIYGNQQSLKKSKSNDKNLKNTSKKVNSESDESLNDFHQYCKFK